MQSKIILKLCTKLPTNGESKKKSWTFENSYHTSKNKFFRGRLFGACIVYDFIFNYICGVDVYRY